MYARGGIRLAVGLRRCRFASLPPISPAPTPLPSTPVESAATVVAAESLSSSSSNNRHHRSRRMVYSQIAVVVALATAAGSLMAHYASRFLDHAGIFHYSPDDDDDDDSDNGGNKDNGDGNDDDDNDTKRSAPLISGGIRQRVPIGYAPEDLSLWANRLATEATGDLTLSVTVNFSAWDAPSRAFQLLQLRSFLQGLQAADSQRRLQLPAAKATTPTTPTAVLAQASEEESALVKEFVQRYIGHLERRIKLEQQAAASSSS